MSSEICKEAQRRHMAAEVAFQAYVALVFAFSVMVLVGVYRVLFKGGPAADHLVELLGTITAGAVGSFFASRLADARAYEEQAWADVDEACPKSAAAGPKRWQLFPRLMK